MHDFIMFWFHQNLNIMDHFIFMGDMLNIILSNILIFTTLIIILLMRIMTSQLTVVLSIQIPFSIVITILYHMDLLKYQNMTFNLKNVTNSDVIKHKFLNTTQYACISMSSLLKNHYKSPFTAMNLHFYDKSVATETTHSDTPAIYDSSKCTQLFVGKNSLVYSTIYTC